MLITKAPRAKLFHPKLFGCAFKTLATLETIVTQAPLGSKQKKGCVTMSVKRGDIYYADLSPVIGSEQGGLRPVLIVQNDIGNRYSPTVIAAAITSQQQKAKILAKSNPTGQVVNRIGLTTSTKLGGAVVRSRVRRILREGLRALERRKALKKGFLIVIAARSAAVKLKSTDIERELDCAFTKLGMYKAL